MSRSEGNRPQPESNADTRLKAVALKYEPDKNNAPCVVASGTGPVAQRILQTAMENGVAIYHDDSTATLLARLEQGREIPPDLYQIVVNIYLSLLDLTDQIK